MSDASGMRRTWVLICGLAILVGCRPPSNTSSSNTSSTNTASTAGPSPKPRQLADQAQPPKRAQPAGSGSKSSPAAQPGTELQPAADSGQPLAVDSGKQNPPAELGQIDPANLVMPKVLLSSGQTATCLVGVGDPMPAIRLSDLAGKEQPLMQLLGERLTVVLFWRGGNPYSVAELADLETDVARPFGRRGVRVVAINELDKPDQVRQTVQKLGLKFPVLLDAKGQALAQVATRKLPRTYLLDASGKIVWFDIEYSRSTWRDLRQAIQFLLSQD